MNPRIISTSILALGLVFLTAVPAMAYYEDCYHFTDELSPSQISRNVHCIAEFQDTWYIGGDFEMIENQPATGIARWDGTQWEPLPFPLSHLGGDLRVEAMCVMDDGMGGGPQLYVGGQFDDANGLEVFNIARWDGTDWSRVDYGVNGPVLALVAVDRDGTGPEPPFLMAGGEFTTVLNFVSEGVGDPVPAAHLAIWENGDWRAPGPMGGLDGTVRALQVLADDELTGQGVCIGGDFTGTEDLSITDLNHFTIYGLDELYLTPAAGIDMGPAATINAFALFDSYANDLRLMMGGDFDTNSGRDCNLMGWDGLDFHYSTGLDGPVYALASCETYFTEDPVLYVGGEFHNMGINSPSPEGASNFVVWTDPYWGDNCPGGPGESGCPDGGANDTVRALLPLARGGTILNSVILGGHFGNTGGVSAFKVSLWEPADKVTIITPPQDTVVCEGSKATFSVQATGEPDLSYQWMYRENGSSGEFTPLIGEDGPILYVYQASPSDEGLYLCEVFNVCGMNSSTSASLTVGDKPEITRQPYLFNTPCLGGTINIKVDFTTEHAATWQWYHDNNPIPSNEFYCQVQIHNASPSDEGHYKVDITNACGTTSSLEVTLILTEGPSITTHPQSQSVREGDFVSFTATASGTDPDFQWRKNGSPLAGATGTLYSIAAATSSDAGDYDFVASNDCGTVASNTAVLTVSANQPPVAIATASPEWCYINQDVSFDGSQSYDPEGFLLEFQWDFGDGVGTSTEVSPTYAFASGAVHDVTLTVTDDLGEVHSDIVQITVSDCQVDPVELDFGMALIGETATGIVTLTNLGSSDFLIDVTENCDVFQIVNGGGPSLVPAFSTQDIEIAFVPTESVISTCPLDIGYHLAPEVGLTGKGVLAWVDYSASSASLGAGGVSIFCYPDGSRDFLNNCYTAGGGRVDGTITLTLIDTEGDPLPDFPAAHIWLTSTAGGLVSCCFKLPHPDEPTDEFGVTTFSGPLFGGGHSTVGEKLRVMVDNQPLIGWDLNVLFNSPDINGDCKVNLSDIGFFAHDYYDPDWYYRSDFDYSGEINLTDVSMLAAAVGVTCVEEKAAPGPVSGRNPRAKLAFHADPEGTTTALSAKPGEPFMVHLLLSGADEGGLTGWECRALTSSNLRVVKWELAGESLNALQAPQFMVGMGEALPAGERILLASAHCIVTDDKPAYLEIGPAEVSSFHPPSPAILTGVSPDKSVLSAAGSSGRLAVNENGYEETVPTQLARVALMPAAPNPFNPQTLIRFELPDSRQVELTIYSVDGRRVVTLVDEVRGQGLHEVYWDGRDARGLAQASGTYFFRLTAGDFQATRRMVMLK